jgi:hypothetical protein
MLSCGGLLKHLVEEFVEWIAMTGLLAQTNASIRDSERRYREARAREENLKRPVVVIDRMIQDLEELNLKGQKRVPLLYEERLRELRDLIGPRPALQAALDNLKVKIGIPKLMDALFAVEETYLAERKGPSLDDPDDLIYAA